MNRKLIRPKFSHYKDSNKQNPSQKKSHPSYDTYAENYYYLKQMNKKTLMGIVFVDGEKIEGQIEWYDYNCLKINRKNAPNLLVFKSNIKYLYKIEPSSKTKG
ncbi:MAG TPA: hypothetical protein ENL46_00485 [Candidatus Aminicenantes bacterium]|nr:hypothetical protein [Candidatus Aminicenantes bacterium]